MKFDCDRLKDLLQAAKDAKAFKQKNWHDWFAWYPVRLGPNDCRWLEVVEARTYPTEFRDNYGFRFWDWEYRSKVSA